MYTVPKLEDYSPPALDRAVCDLLSALEVEASGLHDEGDWKTFRDRWMARKNGLLTQVNDIWLKAAPREAKREVGQRVNELKVRVDAIIDEAQNSVRAAANVARLGDKRLDISLLGIQRRIGVKHPVLRVMDERRLDVLVYPSWNNPPRLIGDLNTPHGNNSPRISPPTGFPAMTVPMGFVRGSLPAGLQILGRPWSEPVLIRIAYAYEQATRHRHPPASTPPLAGAM